MEIRDANVVGYNEAIAEAKAFVVVGIPAFNEEKSIARVVLEAQKFADKVVVCDDGSDDLTGDIAERLGAEVVRHERNFGYGAAIKSLFRRARKLDADILVTLDGDGQHEPCEISSVVKPIIGEEADMVIGSRFIDANGAAEMPSYRRLGTKFITRMVNGSAKNGISDAQSGFRAYSRKALEMLDFFESGMGASVEILLSASKHDLKVCEVASSCKYRNGDVSTSTEHPFTHGIGIMKFIVKFLVEEKPLIMLGIPGLLCLFAGFGFGVWMLRIYALEGVIVTNIALASLSFALIGFLMLSTAITLYAISRLAKKISGGR